MDGCLDSCWNQALSPLTRTAIRGAYGDRTRQKMIDNHPTAPAVHTPKWPPTLRTSRRLPYRRSYRSAIIVSCCRLWVVDVPHSGRQRNRTTTRFSPDFNGRHAQPGHCIALEASTLTFRALVMGEHILQIAIATELFFAVIVTTVVFTTSGAGWESAWRVAPAHIRHGLVYYCCEIQSRICRCIRGWGRARPSAQRRTVETATSNLRAMSVARSGSSSVKR